jgi:23S rRNA pseudouridine2457 synthase
VPDVSRLILFNKPYNVQCQFRATALRRTLADFISVPGVYPAGRLDADSEGLVALTDDGALQHRISDPRHKLAKTYLVQVENIPAPGALSALARGIDIGDGITRPARVRIVDQPQWLWPRDPPIRKRDNIPTCWLELVIHEGRNRQVRRMSAAVGHPTLRLIRYGIGAWNLTGLAPGCWRELMVDAAESPKRIVMLRRNK